MLLKLINILIILILIILSNMCLNPIMIKNPNRGLPLKGLNVLKDCTSSFIPVPCGHCPECIALKQMYFVQRIQMESLSNYLFFGTLTYCDAALSFFEFDDFDGKVYFADIEDIQKMFKRIRNNNLFSRDFKYLVVSEFGSTYHRPHFHFILSLPKYKSDSDFTPLVLERELFDAVLKCWARNTGTDKYPRYERNCIYTRKFRGNKLTYNYDLHFVSPSFTKDGVLSPAWYVLKYMLKGSDYDKRLQRALKLNLSDLMYSYVWSKVKPHLTMSKGLGLVRSNVSRNRENITCDMFDSAISEHIRKCIDFSKQVSPYPLFVNPDNGATFPLSPYYRRYFLTSDDAMYFFNSKYNPRSSDDNFIESKIITDSHFRESCRQFDKIVNMAHSHDIVDFFD